MDMVCVAADGYDIDFLTQGIEQYNDGQFIWSKDRKTSLGADDGIGMAIVLAVLDSKALPTVRWSVCSHGTRRMAWKARQHSRRTY